MQRSGFKLGSFTLLELVVVLGILVVLAGMVTPILDRGLYDAAEGVTRTNLGAVRDAITGRFSYQADVGLRPSTIRDLLVRPTDGTAPPFNPQTGIGWRGPYLMDQGFTYVVQVEAGFTGAYGVEGDPAVPDGWRKPIVLQTPLGDAHRARIVSAGPDGILQTPADVAYPLPASRGDDLLVFLYMADAE